MWVGRRCLAKLGVGCAWRSIRSMPNRHTQRATMLDEPTTEGVFIWRGGRQDACDPAFLADNNIGVCIAAVGKDTEEFEYGLQPEFGCHRIPIGYAGKEKGSDNPKPLRDRPFRFLIMPVRLQNANQAFVSGCQPLNCVSSDPDPPHPHPPQLPITPSYHHGNTPSSYSRRWRACVRHHACMR